MFNSKKGIDDKVSNKLTTLSSQSLIKGDCSIDGDMRIDGTVEGNIRCTGKIVIGPEGKIHGNLCDAGQYLYHQIGNRITG